jgi:hypothetical protein
MRRSAVARLVTSVRLFHHPKVASLPPPEGGFRTSELQLSRTPPSEDGSVQLAWSLTHAMAGSGACVRRHIPGTLCEESRVTAPAGDLMQPGELSRVKELVEIVSWLLSACASCDRRQVSYARTEVWERKSSVLSQELFTSCLGSLSTSVDTVFRKAEAPGGWAGRLVDATPGGARRLRRHEVP